MGGTTNSCYDIANIICQTIIVFQIVLDQPALIFKWSSADLCQQHWRTIKSTMLMENLFFSSITALHRK